MITRKTRLTIITIFILLILLLLFGAFWFFLRNAPQTTQEPVVRVEVKEVVPVRPTVSDMELEASREERNNSSDVVSLSKSFVERYGSFSNEADFGNLRDVLPLMSVAFSAHTQKMIESAVAPSDYYGVSTKVITLNVGEKDEVGGTASATAMTQREESVGSPQNTTVKYQEIVLTFVLEDGIWKVDSAVWQ